MIIGSQGHDPRLVHLYISILNILAIYFNFYNGGSVMQIVTGAKTIRPQIIIELSQTVADLGIVKGGNLTFAVDKRSCSDCARLKTGLKVGAGGICPPPVWRLKVLPPTLSKMIAVRMLICLFGGHKTDIAYSVADIIGRKGLLTSP
jgi:hypothetical protein